MPPPDQQSAERSHGGVGGLAAGVWRHSPCGRQFLWVTQRHRWADRLASRVSRRARKRVEEVLGWMKTAGGFRRTRYRGLDGTGLAGYLVATACNLARMAKLLLIQQGRPPSWECASSTQSGAGAHDAVDSRYLARDRCPCLAVSPGRLWGGGLPGWPARGCRPQASLVE